MSKKTLHIHIGSHKTATTSLQNTFAASDDLMAQAGLLYPKTGRKYRAHHPLAWQLRDPSLSEVELESLGDWPTVLQEIDADPSDHVILSSEDFEWIKSIGRLDVLNKRYNVQILYYMRSPNQYLESFYNQIVKDYSSREERTLETYLAEHGLFFLDNLKILNRWGEVFGRQNIRVRLFGSQYIKDNIIADFQESIGCHAEIAYRKPIEAIQQKVSLPPDALEYLRLCNPHFDRQPGHHDFVVKLGKMARENRNAMQQTRAGLLSIESQRNVLRRFLDRNRQVARTYLDSDRSPFVPSQARAHPDFETRMPIADVNVMAKVAAMLKNFD